MHQRGRSQRAIVRILAAAIGAGILVLSSVTAAQAAPTDRKPRGPLDKAPAGSVAYLDGDELIIATPEKDGGASAAMYFGAPGVNGATLLSQLKAAGVVESTIKATNRAAGFATPPGPSDPLWTCPSGYGTAAFLGGTSSCSLGTRVNWRNEGFSDPQVYFRDHTPARWPVTASVTTWNTAVGIDSFKISGSSSCPGGGRHCVDVWNANYGPNVGWLGYTYVQYDSAYFFLDGQVVVHFNDYYTANTTQDRITACHELGHALGLAHNGSLNSCLYGVQNIHASTTPSTDDFNTLRFVIYP